MISIMIFRNILTPVIKIISILIICLNYSISYGNIFITYSLNSKTTKEFEKFITSDSIVIINLNNTIVTPKSNMFRFSNNPYRNLIDSIAKSAREMPAINKSVAAFLLNHKQQLVENEWPRFINNIKSKGIIVFGMHYTQINERALIKNREELYYNKLKELNITFTEDINDQKAAEIVADAKIKPIIYKGIFFTNDLSKSEAILALTKNISFIYDIKKVIVIDNNKKQLERIQNALRELDIKFYGLHYLAERDIPGEPNINLANFQQDMLIKKYQWLEDDEAQQLLLKLSNEPKDK